MKKFPVIAIILIGYQNYANGQNWDLFPKNKYSMFELSFNNQPSFIERIVKDSTKVYNDSTNCTLGRIMDAGSYFSLNTKVGLSSCNGSTAVGAIINGEKWGITNISTGVSETANLLVRIYPNPCYDKLFVQLNNSEKFDYRLFNIKGQLIKGGQIKARYIDLSDLQNGFYNLQIYNDKIQITRKIIKINNR